MGQEHADIRSTHITNNLQFGIVKTECQVFRNQHLTLLPVYAVGPIRIHATANQHHTRRHHRKIKSARNRARRKDLHRNQKMNVRTPPSRHLGKQAPRKMSRRVWVLTGRIYTGPMAA